MSEGRKVLFVAGGTGGHIVPALAVAQKLKQIDPKIDIIFCGVGKDAEKKLIIPAGFTLVELPFPPFRGVNILKKLAFIFALPATVLKARGLLKKLKINSLIAFGGYPSVCPLIGAWSLGIKTVLHEQNQQVGLANKLLEFFANKIFAVTGATGFRKPQSITYLPIPIRSSFREIQPLEISGDPRLLVLGGSQGAKKVNDAIVELLPFLKENKITIFHQSGTADYLRICKAYDGYERGEVAAFTNDVAGALSNAWIVVSRAGAMSVAEISAAGRCAIYIPLAIAGAHQSANIEEVLKNSAAFCVKQDDELASNLKKKISELLADREQILRVSNKARQLCIQGDLCSEEIIARAI